jgi:hypothetical protein
VLKCGTSWQTKVETDLLTGGKRQLIVTRLHELIVAEGYDFGVTLVKTRCPSGQRHRGASLVSRRDGRGCIARMQPDLERGLLRVTRSARLSRTRCNCWLRLIRRPRTSRRHTRAHRSYRAASSATRSPLSSRSTLRPLPAREQSDSPSTRHRPHPLPYRSTGSTATWRRPR